MNFRFNIIYLASLRRFKGRPALKRRENRTIILIKTLSNLDTILRYFFRVVGGGLAARGVKSLTFS